MTYCVNSPENRFSVRLFLTAIDEQTMKRAAIDDPDLKPLWESMGGTLWKRAE
jgi:hypothetical protein